MGLEVSTDVKSDDSEVTGDSVRCVVPAVDPSVATDVLLVLAELEV